MTSYLSSSFLKHNFLKHFFIFARRFLYALKNGVGKSKNTGFGLNGQMFVSVNFSFMSCYKNYLQKEKFKQLANFPTPFLNHIILDYTCQVSEKNSNVEQNWSFFFQYSYFSLNFISMCNHSLNDNFNKMLYFQKYLCF